MNVEPLIDELLLLRYTGLKVYDASVNKEIEVRCELLFATADLRGLPDLICNRQSPCYSGACHRCCIVGQKRQVTRLRVKPKPKRKAAPVPSKRPVDEIELRADDAMRAEADERDAEDEPDQEMHEHDNNGNSDDDDGDGDECGDDQRNKKQRVAAASTSLTNSSPYSSSSSSSSASSSASSASSSSSVPDGMEQYEAGIDATFYARNVCYLDKDSRFREWYAQHLGVDNVEKVQLVDDGPFISIHDPRVPQPTEKTREMVEKMMDDVEDARVLGDKFYKNAVEETGYFARHVFARLPYFNPVLHYINDFMHKMYNTVKIIFQYIVHAHFDTARHKAFIGEHRRFSESSADQFGAYANDDDAGWNDTNAWIKQHVRVHTYTHARMCIHIHRSRECVCVCVCMCV
jgi:hypothetical protein